MKWGVLEGGIGNAECGMRNLSILDLGLWIAASGLSEL